MQQGLERKSAAALGWSTVEALARQGLQFLIVVVLARLLAPAEFGIMAMISLFIAVAELFANGGFSSALIQKQDVSRADTSSVFFFNMASAAASALLLWAAAPWIAAFYDTPLLAPLTRLMSLNLLLGALGAVHAALLTKELDFRTQAHISVVATVLSGGVAVVLAWHGWGIWSLAVQTLASSLVTTALLWCWRPWRPECSFKISALQSLFRFGGYLFLSGLIDVIYTRVHTLLIGKFYSPHVLGFYMRADVTRQVPPTMLASIVGRVTFPLFSSVADNREVLYRGLRKSITMLMLVNLPVCLGLAVVARPLVLTIYGEKWAPCIPFLQVLSVAAVFWPLHVANLNLLKAMGRSDLFFRLAVVKKILAICFLLLASAVSVFAMAWSVVLLSAISYGINAYYTSLLMGYPATRQIRDFLPCLLAAGAMAAAIWPLSCAPFLSPPLLLAAQVSVGAVLYVTLHIFFGTAPAQEFLRQVSLWVAPAKRLTGENRDIVVNNAQVDHTT